MQLKTARAARWRDDFNELYNKANAEEAEDHLRRSWYRAKRSQLDSIKALVATVEEHWDGILARQTCRSASSRERTPLERGPSVGLAATARRRR